MKIIKYQYQCVVIKLKTKTKLLYIKKIQNFILNFYFYFKLCLKVWLIPVIHIL